VKKLLVVFLLVVSAFAFDWSGKVDWAMSYNQAKMISKQTGKPIFVDFALSHCPPCHWISGNIYTNDKIANYMNKHFINLLYVVDEQVPPYEVRQYFKGSTPTLIIIKNGKLIKNQIGLQRSWLNNPENFIDFLKVK
jgi:thioredoxin 1